MNNHPDDSEYVCRVLVVDDDDYVRRGLEAWLTQRGLLVLTAHDLKTAIREAEAGEPDVILLDVKLGNETGLDLLPLMRSAGLDIPCVVLTANAGPNEGFQAHRLGVVDLIEKPSSPDEIAATLRRVVARWRAAAPPQSQRHSVVINEHGSLVSEVMRLVDERFSLKGLTIQSLARSMNVSPGHLSKLFRRQVGCSVITYVHRRRLSLAVHLLKTTSLSVKEVAHECGYHGSSELDRQFSRKYGQSPRRFRETG